MSATPRGFWWLLGCLLVAPTACSRGGGSAGRGPGVSEIALLDIQFPDPSGQFALPLADTPSNTSLVQQVVFVFSGPPAADSVHSESLRIKDSAEFPVAGEYRVEGSRVVFTPQLPTRPIDASRAPAFDLGGLSLLPSTTYFVEVIAGGSQSVANLSVIGADVRGRYQHPIWSNAVLASFTTTADETLFLTGLPVAGIALVQVEPRDGFAPFSPGLYGDPLHWFSDQEPIRLTFDGPLHPDGDSVSDLTFRVRDLDDRGLDPMGLSLGVEVTLRESRATRSVVELCPTGILPLGHLLAVEIPDSPRHLSDPTLLPASRRVAATYTTAADPGGKIPDRFEEDFDTDDWFDASASAGIRGVAPASWNQGDSHVLQAAIAFPGSGELGDLLPPASGGPPYLLSLDTNLQSFPLLDGSTPGAPAGTVVEGGVFHFRDIVIPANVTLRPVGSNPLVLTATGTVLIAGTIDLRGSNGNSDSTYDSGVSPIPGGRSGAGGGRGGDSHPPVFFPPGQLGIMNLISPPRGQDGYGPAVGGVFTVGGEGGATCVMDDPDLPNPEGDCSEVQPERRDRGAHGGGGSLLQEGIQGAVGFGNIGPRADGTWFDRGADFAVGGKPGPKVFADRNANNDYIGLRGEIQKIRGGQGGGGGGSMAEGYYCGFLLPWGRNEWRGKFPDTTSDSRGGGGGGGGGALEIQALDTITLLAGARILASGGTGGGGEVLAQSDLGGGGGGGSGGAVLLKSGAGVDLRVSSLVDVRGGAGDTGNPRNRGTGGHGLLQVQVPVDQVATTNGTIQPASSYLDPTNTLNPVEFGPVSQATSRWIDMGRAIVRPPHGPLFQFTGTDPATGVVLTDASGLIPNPDSQPFQFGYLGRINPRTGDYYQDEYPRADWIPPEAQVIIEFQAAPALTPGSREVDLAAATAWTPDVTQVAGHQFVRWRITFDVAAQGQQIDASTKYVACQRFRLDFEF